MNLISKCMYLLAGGMIMRVTTKGQVTIPLDIREK